MTTISVTNDFSWQRVGQVARFYYPSFRLPLMLYPAATLTIGILYAVLNTSEIGFLFTSLLSLIISGLFYFFPLFLCRAKSPVVETMLPATSGEKLTFFVVACLIVNPAIIYIPMFAGQYAAELFFTPNELAEGISCVTRQMLSETYGTSVFQSIPPLVTCMFVVITGWRNRIGKAIGFTLLTIIAMSLIGGIFGIIWALSDSFRTMVENNNAVNAYEVGRSISSLIKPMVFIIATFSVIYTALMIWIASRKLRTRQV